MRQTLLAGLAVGVLTLGGFSGTVLADSNPSGTGRPMQSCGSSTAPNTPGGASSASGSAFNPSGNAGTRYAGQQPQNSSNGQASQYDVACYQTSNSGPHH